MDDRVKQLLMLGREHYDRREYDRAERLLRQVLEVTDRYADVYNMLAVILGCVEVAVVPGEAFGPSGFLRLSYALGDDDLVEGVSRIQGLLAEK